MKKVLVTGADGFIGSHLTELLVQKGYDVTAFCFYNSFGHHGWLEESPPELKKSIRFVLGDVRDSACVEKALKGQEAVFHLASLIAIPYSYHAPASYVETNITGTLNVLQGALKHDVGQMLHTSTSEVYGTAQGVPITEDHPLVGQSPYAATKIGADQLALSFYRSFDLPVSVMRPFNTYGPRQSSRAVIPTIMQQLLEGDGGLRLGTIETTRDFNFVTDTAHGMLAFLDNTSTFGEVINIGSGYEVSIKEVAYLIGEVLEKTVTFHEEKERIRPHKSEVERLVCANEKAQKYLEWWPHYAGKEGLKKGLKDTLNWFQETSAGIFLNRSSPTRYIL